MVFDVVSGAGSLIVHSGERLFPPRIGAPQTDCARTLWG